MVAPAGLTPEALGSVTVHGTGTPLGDPIEVSALGQALAGSGSQKAAPGIWKTDSPANHLTLLSVKSCYGHTEGAAGLTGALLAIAALQQRVWTPQIQSWKPRLFSSCMVLKHFLLAFSCARYVVLRDVCQF